MHISVAWLNRLLDPGDCTPDQAEHALTHMGFPIESRTPVAEAPEGVGASGGDVLLDVEVTSNRGDVLCHEGCAREIAAATGRRLKLRVSPALRESVESIDGRFTLENRVPDECPVFTARLIRGVRIGPSPAWLASALAALGQHSVNNVVDASNYALFEFGHPSHAFDLATLRGSKIVIRRAAKGESLAALDGKTHALTTDDVIVADAERAVGLAGVIGGVETSVTARTTDILLEVATWAPASVRRAARRLGIRTDASHRYERLVPGALTIAASERIASLIVEVAGGEAHRGMLAAPEGAPAALMAKKTIIDLRTPRCDALLGFKTEPSRAATLLASLGVEATPRPASPTTLACVIPAHRPDLTREVDLIEEVGRTRGLDAVPTPNRITIDARPPQDSERALRALAETLAGMGFWEAVTFSFVSREEAEAFMPPGLRTLAVDEARRPGEPALRPSVLPSLLRCARANRNAGARPEGGLRFFETASVFAEMEGGKTIENRNLALLVDRARGDAQEAYRLVRGAVEAVVRVLGGAEAPLRIEPGAPFLPALTPAPGACGAVTLAGRPAGYIGLLGAEALARHGLEGPAAGAEIGLDALLALFPPKASVRALPAFPGTERDLSVVTPEAVAWASIESVATNSRLERCVGVEFVGVYRGKQVGAGKKSVTLRLSFRDEARTLRSEEVEPEVTRLVEALRRELGAELRA